MGKRTENLAKKVKPNMDYLADFSQDDHSMDGMEEYRVVPRLKIIQSTTDQELKKKYGEGSVIVRPGDTCVFQDGDEPFQFVPQFFLVEFAKWRDMKDTEPMPIMERTRDISNIIARKARNAEERFEIYEGLEDKPPAQQMKYRYVEHLRFLGIIYGNHSLAGTPCSLSFERGEFFQGKNFISAVKLRKQKIIHDDETIKIVNVPLFLQIWEFKVGYRDRGDRKWFGFDFDCPEVSVIPPELAGEMRESHDELKELDAKNRLIVAEDDIETEEATIADNAEM